MPRWDPGTEQRLTRAALDLFSAYGYDNVTITQIAEMAGVTRRSYFRYFPDKREVLFAGSERLPPAIADAVLAADDHLDPFAAAMQAVARVGASLVLQTERAAERRAVISGSSELQERDRTKTAAVASAIREALHRRGAPSDQAGLLAHLATLVFENAYVRWVETQGRQGFESHVHAVVGTIRDSVLEAPNGDQRTHRRTGPASGR